MFTWIFHSYSENRLFISKVEAAALSELYPPFILQESSIRWLYLILGMNLTGYFLYAKFVSADTTTFQLGRFWLSSRPGSIRCLLPLSLGYFWQVYFKVCKTHVQWKQLFFRAGWWNPCLSLAANSLICSWSVTSPLPTADRWLSLAPSEVVVFSIHPSRS